MISILKTDKYVRRKKIRSISNTFEKYVYIFFSAPKINVNMLYVLPTLRPASLNCPRSPKSLTWMRCVSVWLNWIWDFWSQQCVWWDAEHGPPANLHDLDWPTADRSSIRADERQSQSVRTCHAKIYKILRISNKISIEQNVLYKIQSANSLDTLRCQIRPNDRIDLWPIQWIHIFVDVIGHVAPQWICCRRQHQVDAILFAVTDKCAVLARLHVIVND